MNNKNIINLIRLVMPFYRQENKDKLIDAYRPMNVILHPIMFQDEVTDFNESWIEPFIIPIDSSKCQAERIECFKRNKFIAGHPFSDEDYYACVDDDDMYEPGVFGEIKKMDEDIVIISMKRGNNIPDDIIPTRRYPTTTLIANPEKVCLGEISGQQSFVKGKIFKDHLFNENYHCGDGEMAIHHKESGEQIAYRPDLFALFNYFEPQRWEEKLKVFSIIIPVFNQHEITLECLEAIKKNTKGYEIILVDNGSTPPFFKVNDDIIEIDGVDYKAIRNETNLGFPVAVNQGIKAARGEVIVLLNNDVIVTKNWAELLLEHLYSYAIVGPVTNYCAGLQRVSIPVYQDEQELNREAEKWAYANHGEGSCQGLNREVNWIIGFCMAFKKSLWEEIGPFDESLWPCSGEELDFCAKAKKNGHKIGIALDTYVHHYGSVTFKGMENAGMVNYKGTCDRNDLHLAEKWGEEIFKQQVEKTDLQGIKINLGCGFRKLEGFINIDNRPEVSPDLVCDILEGLPFDDNSVDCVRAYDFLEHCPIGKVVGVITDIWRVLKPGGIFESFTPSTDGRGAFMDPSHCSFWNKNSWLYYSDPAYRGLYGMVPDFEIEKIEDTIPDPQWKIIHTHVIAKARKET